MRVRAGTPSPISPREESHRALQDVALFAQHPILPPQPGQFLTLIAGQALSTALVDLGLLDPAPDRLLGQVQISGHLADRAVAGSAQLDDLGLELGVKRPPPSSMLVRGVL